MADQDPSSLPTSSGADFEDELNPAQLQAVRSLDGPYLVVAGAGTGKTRTLVYRVANLVQRGVRPESVLLLTFTRRAAQEMLRRASAILDERCGRVAGGTFHSFANLVLRRYAKLVGFESNFTILDRADAADLVSVLRTEGGYAQGKKRFPRKDTLIDMFSKEVNTGRSLESLVEDEYPHFIEELGSIAEIGSCYAKRKQEQNVMDYDDLLVNLRKLLAEHDKVRRKIAATYRYVMLDEYQDTNRLQAHVAALVASGHGNLMVVGDDAQSIYSFRGAHFKNIIDFPLIFPRTETIVLERNYRSTQPVLDLGNAIMRNARERHTKELFTTLSTGSKPIFVRTDDDFSQAVFIAQRLLELREEGMELSEMAILARAAWHTNGLEIELKKRNIPFRKFGGIKFVEAAHIKDVNAFLKLSLNPRDAAGWFRILQLCEGIGPKIAQRIGQVLAAHDGDFEALGQTDRESKRYGEDLRGLAGALIGLRDQSLAVSERLNRAVAVYKKLMPRKYDDVERRGRDLEALGVIAERYTSLETFLSDLAIDPPEVGRPARERDPEDEWVTLSTIHSAKGLEWGTVFIVNLTEGCFPVISRVSGPDSFAEERRLFYVAVTRAKENLYLMRPEEMPGRGPYADALAPLSTLICEIQDFHELVEEEHFTAAQELESRFDDDAVEPGDETFHHIQNYFGVE